MDIINKKYLDFKVVRPISSSNVICVDFPSLNITNNIKETLINY